MKTRLWIQGTLCVLVSFMLIVVSLITSVEIAAYGEFGYYEKEYRKYGVLEQLDMTMEDVMDVTIYMMSYLRGEKEVLSIEKVIEGERQDFFNEQDRFHMKEVQDLFLGGIWIRRTALVVLFLAGGILVWMKGEWRTLFPRVFQGVLGILGAAVVALGMAILVDFTKCFVLFHELFFDNDQWIFDARTDYMIRMLPEGFFLDMAVRIGGIFVFILGMLLLGSILLKKIEKT